MSPPRVAILVSPLHELTGFCLAVDCLAHRCSGERTFAIADLASFYGRESTVGEVLSPHALLEGLWRARRSSMAGDGPILNARTKPRRVPLLGPEARE